MKFAVIFDRGQWVAVAHDEFGNTRHILYCQTFEQAVMAIASETGQRVIVPVEVMQP